MRHAVRVATLFALVILWCAYAEAVTVNKCQAGKKKCVGNKVSCLLGCHAKAEQTGALDGNCILKCKQKFDGNLLIPPNGTKGCIQKLQQKGNCLTGDETITMETKIDAFVDDVVNTLDPGGPHVNGCQAGKKKCVSKKAKCLLGCHAKFETKGVFDSGCLLKCMQKFDGNLLVPADPTKGCIHKLQAKGDCLTADETTTMEAKVDAFVDDVVCDLDPSEGTCPVATPTGAGTATPTPVAATATPTPVAPTATPTSLAPTATATATLTPTPTRTPFCGDGLVVAPEGCDDVNTNETDGCLSNCTVHAGFTCTGEPSVCTCTGPTFVCSDTATPTATPTTNPTATCTGPSSFCDGGTQTTTPTPCPGGVCPSETATPTPVATATPIKKRVFISSTRSAGSFGGLSGGDAICQSLADAAGLGGTYMAWLSDGSTSPATRFTQATVPYVEVDPHQTQIASDWTDLVDGALTNPIVFTETAGSLSGVPVWTGTKSLSGAGGGTNCHGWTSSAATDTGLLGVSGDTTSWSDSSATRCDATAYLYCFEQ